MSFAASLSSRSADPVLPQIAYDLSVTPTTATLLATAFAIPYAVMQPVLGALADMFGKARLLLLCALILVIAAFISAVATSFPMLFAARVLFGIGTGGVFPISVAITGDLVPVHGRQVAIARMLAASMTGVVLGAAGAGVAGDLIGWRGVFWLNTFLGAICFVACAAGLRAMLAEKPEPRGLASVVAGYKSILRHPLAPVCFGAVLVEGICIQGLFPFVSVMLHDQGEERSSIPGLVLAAWGAGGFIYSMMIVHLLRRFSERSLMIMGGSLTASSLVVMSFDPRWQIAFAVFLSLGISFYLLHGVIQLYASELSTESRGTAMALHSAFFFFGMASGPVIYAAGFSAIGIMPTLLLAATAIMAIALICARFLHRSAMRPELG